MDYSNIPQVPPNLQASDVAAHIDGLVASLKRPVLIRMVGDGVLSSIHVVMNLLSKRFAVSTFQGDSRLSFDTTLIYGSLRASKPDSWRHEVAACMIVSPLAEPIDVF